ncbi:hypothetical protein LSTR_LSTR005270 [Laodelphax striatellus]|uniref:Cyclic nucleotide-binding domain-containing protein n=1 Tax=Laodelphax striatellus TaxID=195883 RepID=A0A482X8I9_LAOST|nr:hypothetical protein LSTR_LSTR005270 [Laodelphax striatellus]
MKVVRRGGLENEVYVPTHKEDSLNWREIVFLPFNTYWRFLLLVFCIAEFVTVVYIEVFKVTYSLERTENLNSLLHLVDAFFAIDLMFSIIHKTWLPVNKSKTFISKTITVIIVDFFSLIPFYLLIKDSFLTRDHKISWLAILNMNRCCRIYRVFLEAFRLRQVMGLNRVVVTFIAFNAIFLTSSLILGTVWFVMGYTQMDDYGSESWLSRIGLLRLDEDNPTEMCMFSFIYALNTLNNNLTTDLRTVTLWELIFEDFLKLMGFVMKHGLGIAFFISSIIGFHRHQYKIREYIDINMQYLEGYKEKEVKDYYNTFWHVWSGLQTCPLLEELPLCLQKDLLTDIYWDAIEHSNVLRHFDISIKRHISLFMRSKFLQPGDYIYRKGEIRYAFYYITHGVVEVMSHYDGVSPILTISKGSCIGSMSVGLPSKCPTDIICSSFCEVFYLTYDSLRTVLMMYPPSEGSVKLSRILRKQTEHAKLMICLSTAYSVHDRVQDMYGVPHSGKLNWIKNRWRTLHRLGDLIPSALTTDKVITKLKNEHLPIETIHTSMNLDLLVLSTKESSSASRCCLKSSCSYIMEPQNNFLKIWLHLMVVMVSLDCIIVPANIAFGFIDIEWLIIWSQNIALLYLFDIYFQAITAVKTIDEPITEPMPLLRHRLKDIFFLLEAVAAIPIGTISRLFAQYDKLTAYQNFNRLLKIVHVFCFFNYKYTLIMGKRIIIDIIKYVYVCFYLLYFASCFFFVMACEVQKDGEMECLTRSWYNWGKIVRRSFELGEDVTYYSSYLLNSLSFSMIMCLRTGVQDILPISYDDIVFCNIVILVSSNIVLWIYSESIAVSILGKERLIQCRELIESINSVLTQKNIHQGLRTMLGKYIELQWISNSAIAIDKTKSRENEVISPMLIEKFDLLKRTTVCNVPFFQEMEPELLEKVIDAFSIYNVPKGFIFCRSGEHSSSFNILIKGYCNVTSMMREDVREFPAGKEVGPEAFFPLMEILLNSQCFSTAISVTECKVATIEVFKLRELISEDMFILNDIKNASTSAEKDVDIVVSKTKYRRERIRTRNFILLNRKGSISKSQKISSFSAFFQYIMLPFMIEPSGPFIYCYEGYKLVRVVMSIIYFSSYYTLFCFLGETRINIGLIFDVLSFVDVYISFNVGSYNEDGLLISSPQYYLEHAFVVDFLSSLPIYFILEEFKLEVKFYALLSVKVLQIYRLHRYFSALISRFDNHVIKLTMISFVLHWALISVCISNGFFVHSCDIKCEGGEQIPICKELSWYSTNEYYSQSNSVFELVLFSYDMLLTMFLGNSHNGFRVTQHSEAIIVMFIAIASSAIRIYYITKIGSLMIGGKVHMRKYSENIKLYWRFIADQGGERAVANNIYNHFQYDHARSKGLDMRSYLDSLHPTIRMDLAFALYYRAIEILHQFVGENRSFMKLIANVLVEGYYRKGTTIINRNQLNDKIYFVSQGAIDVYDDDDQVYKSLSRGSMFGSLSISGKSRHRRTFKSRVHSNLLEMSSSEFYMLFRQYDSEKEKIFEDDAKSREYFEYRSDAAHNEFIDEDEGIDVKDSLLYKNSYFHQWLMFGLSSLLPYLTLFPVMYTIATAYEDGNTLITMIYILDLISLLRIYVGMNTTFSDENTGRLITNKTKIRLSYVLNKMGLWLDVASVVPIELIVHLLTSSERPVIAILRANRLLRLIMLLDYVLQHREKHYIKSWLRWQEIVIYMTVLPFIFVCFWMYFACGETDCNFKANDQWLTNLTPFQMFVITTDKVVTLITMMPTFTYKSPVSNQECIMMIISLMIIFLLLPFAIGHFTQVYEAADFQKKNYQYKLDCMKSFLQIRDLSDSLLQSLWSYSLLFWRTSHGQTYPDYVEKAPMNLKSQLLSDLYGDHLKFNALFDDCSNDFIIQLSQRLKRAVYFPGNFLIRKYDVDDRMYFINSGEVDVVEFDDLHMEVDQNIHITGECFGLAQGLFDRTPHFAYYKARNTVEVLHLQKSDWEDLLDAFPQEKMKIYRNAERLDLQEVD